MPYYIRQTGHYQIECDNCEATEIGGGDFVGLAKQLAVRGWVFGYWSGGWAIICRECHGRAKVALAPDVTSKAANS